MKSKIISKIFAVLMLSIMLAGTALAQIQAGLGVEADVNVNGNSLGLAVQAQTMQKARLGEPFKAQAGMTFDIEGKYRLEILQVHNNPVTDVIPGANIAVTATSTAAEEAPVEFYLTQAESFYFKNKIKITMTQMDGDSIVLSAEEFEFADANSVYTTVNVGEEFKAMKGQVFLIDNRLKIVVAEIYMVNPTTDSNQPVALLELHDYISNPAMMRPIASPIKAELSRNEIVQYMDYNVQLTASTQDAIALRVTKGVPQLAQHRAIITAQNTLQVQSEGAVPVNIIRVKIAPGSTNPVFESNEGIVDVAPNMLSEGFELQVRSRGEVSRLRIEANEERLETYITENNVQARTRANVVNDENGLALELSNGARAEVKVLPEQASDRAKEVLTQIFGAIELKQAGDKAVYEAKARENFRVLGFIPVKGYMSVEIDTETGEILKTKKPWFSFMSAHVKN